MIYETGAYILIEVPLPEKIAGALQHTPPPPPRVSRSTLGKFKVFRRILAVSVIGHRYRIP